MMRGFQLRNLYPEIASDIDELITLGSLLEYKLKEELGTFSYVLEIEKLIWYYRISISFCFNTSNDPVAIDLYQGKIHYHCEGEDYSHKPYQMFNCRLDDERYCAVFKKVLQEVKEAL